MCCKLSLAEGWRPSTTTSPFAKAKGEKSPSPLSPALSCRKSQTPIGVVHRGMVPQCCQLEQVQLEPRAIVQRKRPPPPNAKTDSHSSSYLPKLTTTSTKIRSGTLFTSVRYGKCTGAPSITAISAIVSQLSWNLSSTSSLL